MKNESLLSKFLLSNPFQRGMIEWGILVLTGICGLTLSWYNYSFFPFSNIAGGIIIVSAFLFHWRAEKDHHQAHERTDNIDMIVKTGVYAKILHPLYLSIIVFNIGIALSFGDIVTLSFALLTVFHWIATAYYEERELEDKFHEEYINYKKEVRWRMIPGVF